MQLFGCVSKLFKEKIEPCLVPNEKDGERQINKTMKNFGMKMGADIKEADTTDEAISKLTDKFSERIADVEKRHNEKLENLFNQQLTQISKTQKLIPESELEQHMRDGWEYRDNLRSGNVIIERGVTNEK